MAAEAAKAATGFLSSTFKIATSRPVLFLGGAFLTASLGLGAAFAGPALASIPLPADGNVKDIVAAGFDAVKTCLFEGFPDAVAALRSG